MIKKLEKDIRKAKGLIIDKLILEGRDDDTILKILDCFDFAVHCSLKIGAIKGFRLCEQTQREAKNIF